MKLSASSMLVAAVPAVLATPLLVPTPGQSPNIETRYIPFNLVTLEGCSGEDDPPKCTPWYIVQDKCYSWDSLFPNFENGAVLTGSFGLYFYDQAGCTGTQSNRVCNESIFSDEDYWYTHTVSLRSDSSFTSCKT